jgi:hypothetical protein
MWKVYDTKRMLSNCENSHGLWPGELKKRLLQWSLSNPTHQGTREMCQIVQDFILVNRNTFEP